MRQHGLKIPIIALTAHAMKGIEAECISVGYSGYLGKPIKIDGLIEKVAHELGGKPIEKAKLDAQPVPVNIGISDSPHVVPSLDMNNPRYRELIDKFILRLGSRLEDMENAWKDRDFEQLNSLCHWLKGSAGTVGLDAFTAPARALEEMAKLKNESAIPDLLQQLNILFANIRLDGNASAIPGLSFKPAPAVTKALYSSLPDNKKCRSLVQKFVIRFEAKLQEMEKAQLEMDWDAMLDFAHWLKGSAGTMGFGDFTEPAENLESFVNMKSMERVASQTESIIELYHAIEVERPSLPTLTDSMAANVWHEKNQRRE